MNDWTQQLIEKGLPPDEARMLTDLAVHAVQQGLETVARICDTAPDERGQTICMVVACGMLSAQMRNAAKNIDLIVKEMKQHMGME